VSAAAGRTSNVRVMVENLANARAVLHSRGHASNRHRPNGCAKHESDAVHGRARQGQNLGHSIFMDIL